MAEDTIIKRKYYFNGKTGSHMMVRPEDEESFLASEASAGFEEAIPMRVKEKDFVSGKTASKTFWLHTKTAHDDYLSAQNRFGPSNVEIPVDELPTGYWDGLAPQPKPGPASSTKEFFKALPGAIGESIVEAPGAALAAGQKIKDAPADVFTAIRNKLADRAADESAYALAEAAALLDDPDAKLLEAAPSPVLPSGAPKPDTSSAVDQALRRNAERRLRIKALSVQQQAEEANAITQGLQIGQRVAENMPKIDTNASIRPPASDGGTKRVQMAQPSLVPTTTPKPATAIPEMKAPSMVPTPEKGMTDQQLFQTLEALQMMDAGAKTPQTQRNTRQMMTPEGQKALESQELVVNIMERAPMAALVGPKALTALAVGAPAVEAAVEQQEVDPNAAPSGSLARHWQMGAERFTRQRDLGARGQPRNAQEVQDFLNLDAEMTEKQKAVKTSDNYFVRGAQGLAASVPAMVATTIRGGGSTLLNTKDWVDQGTAEIFTEAVKRSGVPAEKMTDEQIAENWAIARVGGVVYGGIEMVQSVVPGIKGTGADVAGGVMRKYLHKVATSPSFRAKVLRYGARIEAEAGEEFFQQLTQDITGDLVATDLSGESKMRGTGEYLRNAGTALAEAQIPSGGMVLGGAVISPERLPDRTKTAQNVEGKRNEQDIPRERNNTENRGDVSERLETPWQAPVQLQGVPAEQNDNQSGAAGRGAQAQDAVTLIDEPDLKAIRRADGQYEIEVDGERTTLDPKNKNDVSIIEAIDPDVKRANVRRIVQERAAESPAPVEVVDSVDQLPDDVKRRAGIAPDQSVAANKMINDQPAGRPGGETVPDPAQQAGAASSTPGTTTDSNAQPGAEMSARSEAQAETPELMTPDDVRRNINKSIQDGRVFVSKSSTVWGPVELKSSNGKFEVRITDGPDGFGANPHQGESKHEFIVDGNIIFESEWHSGRAIPDTILLEFDRAVREGDRYVFKGEKAEAKPTERLRELESRIAEIDSLLMDLPTDSNEYAELQDEMMWMDLERSEIRREIQKQVYTSKPSRIQDGEKRADSTTSAPMAETGSENSKEGQEVRMPDGAAVEAVNAGEPISAGGDMATTATPPGSPAKKRGVPGYKSRGVTPVMDYIRDNARLLAKSKMRHASGEYDGVPSIKELGGFARAVFGGTQTPDQVATMLFDAGLIPDAHPDTMWDAMRAEMDAHRSASAREKEMSKAGYWEQVEADAKARVAKGIESGELLPIDTEVYVEDDDTVWRITDHRVDPSNILNVQYTIDNGAEMMDVDPSAVTRATAEENADILDQFFSELEEVDNGGQADNGEGSGREARQVEGGNHEEHGKGDVVPRSAGRGVQNDGRQNASLLQEESARYEPEVAPDFGDNAVFKALFDRARNTVRSAYPSINYADADDLAQTAMIKLVKSYKTGTAAKPETVLHTIVINEAKQLFRRNAVRGGAHDSLDADVGGDIGEKHGRTGYDVLDDEAAVDQGPDEQAAGSDLHAKIREGISDPKLRKTFDLIAEGLSDVEVGKKLGISRQMAHKRHKAIKAIVQEMLDNGLRAHMAATGQIPAFYDRATGKIYVIADNLDSSQDLEDFILAEEMIHAGLHNLFGQDLDRAMNRVYTTRAQKEAVISQIGKKYGLLDESGNWRSEDAKSEAAEEWLAHIYSRRTADPTTWERFVAWVKNGLRKMGLNLKMSDSELDVLVSRALRTRQQASRARAEGVRAHKKSAGNKEFKGLDPVTRRKKFDELAPIVVKDDELLALPEPYNAREQNKKAVKKAVERNIIGEVENAISKEKIIISKRGIENALSHGATPLKIQIVGVLKPILKSAIPVDSMVHPQNPQMKERFYASKVTFRNEDFLVSIVVHEDANGNRFYDHEMMEIEKLDTLMSQSGAASSDVEHTRRYQASVNNIVANALFVNSGIRFHRGPGYYANRPDAATRRREAIRRAVGIRQQQEEQAQPGQHERRTVTRAAYDDHGSGPYAEEAAGARTSGANMADNTPIAALVEAAKTEAAQDPAKVFNDAKAEKDPVLAACKFAGYLEQAKGHFSRQQAFDAIAESGTLAGTLLRVLREVRTFTPEGRADLHTSMFRRWLKQNKLKDLPQNVMDEIRRRFLEAEQQADPDIQAQMIQDAITYAVAHVPRGRFWWQAFRYSNVLSNPRSHERNAVGNVIQAFAMRPLAHAGKGRFITAMRYEVDALAAIPKGLKEAHDALRGKGVSKFLEMEDTTTFTEAMNQRLPGILTITGRLLEAGDRMFGAVIEAAEISRLARAGIDPAKAAERAKMLRERTLFRDRIGSDLRDTSAPALNRAIDSMAYLVDQSRHMPVLNVLTQPMFLFLRTPTAVARRGIEATPLAYLSKGMISRNEIAKNMFGKEWNRLTDEQKALARDEHDERIGLARVGTLVTLAGAALALAGRTTWEPPKDKKEREDFYAAGMKPYSIRIGDNWIPMNTFGPLGFALAIPAAFRDVMLDNPKYAGQGAAEKMARFTWETGRYVVTQTPFMALQNFFEALSGDDYSLSNFSAFTAGQFVPASGFLRYVNMYVDPTYRKPDGFFETIETGIPGLSQRVEARREPDGAAAKRTILDILPPYSVGDSSGPREKMWGRERERRRKELYDRRAGNL